MTKKTLLFLLTSFLYLYTTAQNTKDEWSGLYQLQPYGKVLDSISPKQFYKIQKIILDHDNTSSTYELAVNDQWTMQNMLNIEDKKVLRAFKFSQKKNDYEEFGWTELHQNGNIKCIDGGNLFICKTKVGTKISFGEEKFTTNSGVFGILLHYGIFELYKHTNQKK